MPIERSEIKFGKEMFIKRQHYIEIRNIYGFKKNIEGEVKQDDNFIEEFSLLHKENFVDFIVNKYGEEALNEVPAVIILGSVAVLKKRYINWGFGVKEYLNTEFDRWDSYDDNKEMTTGLTIGFLESDNLFYANAEGDVFSNKDGYDSDIHSDKHENIIIKDQIDMFIKNNILPFKLDGYKKLLDYLIEFSNQTKVLQDIMNSTDKIFQDNINNEINEIKMSLKINYKK